MTPEEFGKKAKEKFMSGYNCTQAVTAAFADELFLQKAD